MNGDDTHLTSKPSPVKNWGEKTCLDKASGEAVVRESQAGS